MKQKARQVITPEIIAQRKFKLITRDPLAIELDELARGVRNNLTSRQLHKRFPHYDFIEIQEQKLTGILEKEVTIKWNISPYPTGKRDSNIPFSWLGIYPASPNVYDLRNYINEILLPKVKTELTYNIEQQEHLKKHGWIYIAGVGGYEKDKTNSIPIPRGGIPIWISPHGLSNNSRKEITKQVWDIVSETIKKQKLQTLKKWHTIPQINEPTELGFIYHTGEHTFNNYLRWYDIHTQEKLSFRILAHYEKQKNKDNFLETVRCKKIKWGISVKGEDKIEKGIKLVYEAIHRKPYKQKNIEPISEEYKCPSHADKECPDSCKYLKEWADRFNRLNPI